MPYFSKCSVRYSDIHRVSEWSYSVTSGVSRVIPICLQGKRWWTLARWRQWCIFLLELFICTGTLAPKLFIRWTLNSPLVCPAHRGFLNCLPHCHVTYSNRSYQQLSLLLISFSFLSFSSSSASYILEWFRFVCQVCWAEVWVGGVTAGEGPSYF